MLNDTANHAHMNYDNNYLHYYLQCIKLYIHTVFS